MSKKQKFPFLVGSKWTAMQETFGWRHFIVTNRKNEGNLVFAELKAACGGTHPHSGNRTVCFWLNAKALNERSLWLPGWQALSEQLPPNTADREDLA
ncbi:TIGR02450 family Trp-rich protein [Tumidithrix elongata RA019]|uniref:TIGR02450 family Trp-rich protein n=1 Tax=Tumidithrix elongata BACA0141 TaxID=2716417 RepID=A0AAW9PZF0_9CYAN|nr:TIGR02450 family Trp-rich protein [Tumidithrix elongata RA019]